jgi:hypothetical protein
MVPTKIMMQSTGVPRKNSINIGLIIFSLIFCIANMPFSLDSSAKALITKLEKANSKPVTSPAPTIAVTIMYIISIILWFSDA